MLNGFLLSSLFIVLAEPPSPPDPDFLCKTLAAMMQARSFEGAASLLANTLPHRTSDEARQLIGTLEGMWEPEPISEYGLERSALVIHSLFKSLHAIPKNNENQLLRDEILSRLAQHISSTIGYLRSLNVSSAPLSKEDSLEFADLYLRIQKEYFSVEQLEEVRGWESGGLQIYIKLQVQLYTAQISYFDSSQPNRAPETADDQISSRTPPIMHAILDDAELSRRVFELLRTDDE